MQSASALGIHPPVRENGVDKINLAVEVQRAKPSESV
jgi:hypothetical protein